MRGKKKKKKKKRKQAQRAEAAGLMASRPMEIKRGKKGVNGTRKPKEQSSKPMGIMRAKGEVKWAEEA